MTTAQGWNQEDTTAISKNRMKEHYQIVVLWDDGIALTYDIYFGDNDIGNVGLGYLKRCMSFFTVWWNEGNELKHLQSTVHVSPSEKRFRRIESVCKKILKWKSADFEFEYEIWKERAIVLLHQMEYDAEALLQALKREGLTSG